MALGLEFSSEYPLPMFSPRTDKGSDLTSCYRKRYKNRKAPPGSIVFFFSLPIVLAGCSASYESGMAGLYVPVEFIFEDDGCGIEAAMNGSTQGYRLGTQWRDQDSDTGEWGRETVSDMIISEGASDILGTFCLGDFPQLQCDLPPQAIYFESWKNDVDWSSTCASGVESVEVGGEGDGLFLTPSRLILKEDIQLSCADSASAYYYESIFCTSRFGAVYERTDG